MARSGAGAAPRLAGLARLGPSTVQMKSNCSDSTARGPGAQAER